MSDSSDKTSKTSSAPTQPVLPELEDRTVIDNFSKEFGFLSNFYECTFYHQGKKYGSVEHAYQAAKATDPTTKEAIREAATPSHAKKLGKSVQLPSNWETTKVGIMRQLVAKKFENPFLKEMLIATGDAELIEGNWWGDRFWGVCKGAGQNWLGRILMDVREQLKKGEVQ